MISSDTILQERLPFVITFIPICALSAAAGMVINMDLSSFFQSYAAVARPGSLTIELTNVCNFRCIHCYHGEHSSINIDKGILMNVIDQFKDLGLYEVTLSGGEPLAHPDFLELLAELNKKRVYINLFTNASLLNHEIIEALEKANVKNVQFSLYGLDYSTFSAVTGTNSLNLFNNYIKGIALLKQSSLDVTCAMVIIKKNFHQRKEMLEFCLNNHFAMRSSYRLISTRTSQDISNLDLSGEEKKQLMGEIISYNKNVDKQNQKIGSLEKEQLPKSVMDGMCTAGSTSFCLSADGDILPCPGYYFTIGNIYTSNVKDILNSSNALKIKNAARKEYKKCFGCKFIKFCAFCPGIIHNEGNGKNFENSSLCQESELFSSLINQ